MKLKLNPPDYFLLMIILSIILDYFLPVIQIVPHYYNYLGVLLIILGVYLNLKVYSKYKKVGNSMKIEDNPRILITKGVFKISRNPIYLGMDLILFGEAVLLGSLICFLIPVIFVISIDIFTIPIEERNLKKNFGKQYLEYKNRVRRWI